MCRSVKPIIQHRHEHLDPKDTIVHFIISHKIFQNQKLSFHAMHGVADVIDHPLRFEDYQDFLDWILPLTHIQSTVGIYFVIHGRWRDKFLKDYLTKINGTVIVWFVGFGNKDEYKDVKQKLIYFYKGCRYEFIVEDNFGHEKILPKNFNIKKYRNVGAKSKVQSI